MNTAQEAVTIEDLEAKVIQTREATETASGRSADLLTRLASGDAAVTSASVTKAEAEITRCELLQRAAAEALKLAVDRPPKPLPPTRSKGR